MGINTTRTDDNKLKNTDKIQNNWIWVQFRNYDFLYTINDPFLEFRAKNPAGNNYDGIVSPY